MHVGACGRYDTLYNESINESIEEVGDPMKRSCADMPAGPMAHQVQLSSWRLSPVQRGLALCPASPACRPVAVHRLSESGAAPCRGGPVSLECLQQGFGILKVRRVKPFGEPGIHRSEQVIGFLALAVLLPQASEASRGTEFPGFRPDPGRYRGRVGNRLRLRGGCLAPAPGAARL
jgi:hypothetical protein